MSSSLSSPEEKPTSEPTGVAAGSDKGWATWRKTMFAGAMVLFASALAEALMNPDQPEALKLLARFVGFGLLAAGFGIRMRNR